VSLWPFEVLNFQKKSKKTLKMPKTPKNRHFLKNPKNGLKMAKNGLKNVSKSVLNFDPYFQKMNTFLGGP
jgi:predicted ATP-dependent serine protease